MWTIGFDGGFSQTFEIQYWGTDQLVRSFNTTNSVFYQTCKDIIFSCDLKRVILRDLNDGEKYSAKVRAINKRFVSQFSEPIEFYVSDDQNFGPLNNDSKVDIKFI
jgi:hypothetical protein